MQTVTTLWLIQNGRNFANDIFNCIFLNEKVWIAIKMPLQGVPKGQINNIPALVQIMALCRPGDKPLSENMAYAEAYMRHSVSMSSYQGTLIYIALQ